MMTKAGKVFKFVFRCCSRDILLLMVVTLSVIYKRYKHQVRRKVVTTALNCNGPVVLSCSYAMYASQFDYRDSHYFHVAYFCPTIPEMICNELFVSSSGASAVDADRVSVSVMEGDTVTLYSDVELNQTDRMFWIFENSRIAIINGDKHKICTDDECKERFRDRLKLDQTGSLIIMNTRTTDSGEYKLKNTTRNTDNIFSVTVHGVSAAERDDMKRKSVKEGESVTLDNRVIKNITDLMRWYFNDALIAEITGDQSKICSDDQCDERFRDRLKLDQNGSLTITDTRNTDSGDYKLKISSSRFSIMRSFTVTVSGEYHLFIQCMFPCYFRIQFNIFRSTK
ncbi:hypothetical protein cypCar_00035424 [Cyprinus carpio]|nr:hypothetical protein cypCar_00035424 [Cyprinus carpio]